MRSLYELKTTQKIPYILFWLLFGTLILGIQQIAEYIYGESHLFWTRVLLTYMTYSLVPILTILISHRFVRMLGELQLHFKIDVEKLNYDEWSELQHKNIFSFKTTSSRIIALVICVGGDIVILATPGFWFQNISLNIFVLIIMQAGFVMAGHAGYMILQSLSFLAKLKDSNVCTPFLLPVRIAISSIASFYTFASIVVLGMYSIHALTLWLVDYNFSPTMTVWLLLGSFFPLIIVVWSFAQINLLTQKIKIHFVETVNLQIQKTFSSGGKKLETRNIESLAKLIDIQNKVELTKTWQVDLGGLLTLIATIIAPAFQIAIALLQYSP